MLNKLPDNARVWIFQANRLLTEKEQAIIHNSMQNFVPQWAAHGKGLSGDHELIENLFLVIGVNEDHAKASGCSIDSLTHKVKEIGSIIDVDFFDRLTITYLNEKGKIELVGMSQFKTMAQENKVDFDTIVFNNLVDNKADLLSNWKVNVKDSWHKNLLNIV